MYSAFVYTSFLQWMHVWNVHRMSLNSTHLTTQSQWGAVQWSQGGTWLGGGVVEQSSDGEHCSHCSLLKGARQATTGSTNSTYS